MRKVRWQYLLVLAVLAAGYYLLLGLVVERLPFIDVPQRWKHVWASSTAATISWFQVLNVVGALTAALPSAALIVWKAKAQRLSLAFAISITTALFVVIAGLATYPGTKHETYAWLNLACYGVFIAVANPFWVWLIGRLPSNQAFKPTGHKKPWPAA